MGNYLRNPEIRHTLGLMAVITVLTGIAGFWFMGVSGLYFLFSDLAIIALYFFSTAKRYRRLQKLCCDIDALLHENAPIRFSDYQEGELAILQNELSKMTLRLMEQAQTLEEDKRFLSNAMADISHQLRSPLTSSQLILSLLRDDSLTAERRSELLLELSQLLSHIGWLVETLLKMAKMDAKTAYFKREEVPLHLLIDKACEPLLIPMELRGLHFSASFSSENDLFTGDLSWSAEAVRNILKNCMEHTPDGGRIEVVCRSTALFCEILIEDSGSGFSSEDLLHLFERFYKGKDSGSQNIGIGLALSHMIITAQNGTIRAENRQEGGARFQIRFYASSAV